MTVLDAIQTQTPQTLGGGRYLVRSMLGRGSTSKVYRCLDRHLGVERAVKILDPLRGRAVTLRQRMLREAAISSRLTHPNLVPVITSGDEDGWVYTVSELVEGASLRDRVRASGTLNPVEALQWMIQVTEGLTVAHADGVVHRDVRPANIMIDRWGTPRLIDFGIAHDAGMDPITEEGFGIGSLGWSAPEQRRDGRSVGPEADVYGVAVTLYWLITGLAPVDLCHCDRSSSRWATVPLPLIPVLVRATRERPVERYGNARALRSALRAALRSLRREHSPWGASRR